MNKPSERIVVFVTPAQKRAISATADELGISISELMRRAVMAFSATSDQVKAASIVDRLNAPREPDALAQVLRKAARPLRTGRAAGLRPGVAQSALESAPTDAHADASADAEPLATAAEAPLAAGSTGSTAASPAAGTEADTADSEETGRAVHELAQAVARLSGEATQAAEVPDAPADAAPPDDAHHANNEAAQALRPLGGAPFSHTTRDEEEDTHRGDPTPDAGKYA